MQKKETEEWVREKRWKKKRDTKCERGLTDLAGFDVGKRP